MQQQKQFKVLLIGDSCIDKYVYGEVKRLNPEAPVPVLDYVRTEERKGMAWNVYNNLTSFGIDVFMETNEEEIIKTRYVDEKTNQQILRVDEEVFCKQLERKTYDEKYDAVVISDYCKGFVSSSRLFEIPNQFDCPIFVDSKRTILPSKNCFLKVNEYEYLALSGKPYNNAIVTYGSKGARYNGVTYPGEKVNVYDVVGAGDTFLAALTYGYLNYGTIEEAIPFANKAAAIAVSHPGTYVLTGEDINALCS